MLNVVLSAAVQTCPSVVNMSRKTLTLFKLQHCRVLEVQPQSRNIILCNSYG